MRSYMHYSILLFLMLALVVPNAQAGRGDYGSNGASAAGKKNLAKLEERASVKTAKAKSAAKQCQADLVGKTSKAKAKAAQQAKTAKAEAMGVFAKKKQQVKNIFNL